jgi:tetratricopeptide (TPR) repeat protein
MTDLSSRSLPPPSNWQDFERLCFDLFSSLWRTNDAQFHGRNGQPQAGVDIYGTDQVEKKFVGVQCKGKDQGFLNPLTAVELRDEVEKALSFVPSLDVFILATTAPNDSAIQKAARELQEQHSVKGLFEIRVAGWSDLRQHLSNHLEVVQKHFPDLAPILVTKELRAGFSSLQEGAQDTQAKLQKICALLEARDQHDGLRTRILDVVHQIEDGDINAGLRSLERLWRSECEAATARNRYLVRANIGLARLTLGDTLLAIPELRAAAAEEPELPNARACMSLAMMLEGDRSAAYALAERALKDDPQSHQAAFVLIEAAPDEMPLAELEAKIPAALSACLDILLNLAARARSAKDVAARGRLLETAGRLFPEDWRTLAAQAERLLAPIVELPGVAFTRTVPSNAFPKLDTSITLLRNAWEKLKRRDNATVGIFVAVNLLSALELSGRTAEHEEFLDEALQVAPENNILLRRYARRMATAGDWPGAARALKRIPPEAVEIADRMFAINASIYTGEPSAAIVAARQLEVETVSGREAEGAAGLQIEAASRTANVEGVVTEVLDRWPHSIMLRSVAQAFLPDESPILARVLEEVSALSQGLRDPIDRLHAADALFKAEHYSAASDMYEGAYSPNIESPALYRTLQSLLLSDRRKEARTLFERLNPDLKSAAYYAELGVSIYEHAGLLREARSLLETALAKDDTVKRRLHWLNLSERLGENVAVSDWLDKVPLDQVGAPCDLMQLAFALDRLRSDPKCFRFAYRALRAGYREPSIHLAYMVDLVFMGKSSSRAFSSPSEVGSDTAVILEEKDGPKKLTRILETEPDPRIEHYEIAPQAELGPLLAGKKVGDEISLPNVGVEPTIYVVREIRDKYRHAHFRSVEQFPVLFPGHKAFGAFAIDESKGDDKFKPIFDSAKRRAELTDELAEKHRSGQLPLMLLSRFSGSSPFDTWEWACANENLGLTVCLGLREELDTGFKAIAEVGKAVIEPITMYGIVRAGIAEKVRACFEDLAIVQTTVDLFRRLAAERGMECERDSGTMGWDGERLHVVRLDRSVKDARLALAKAALAFAESLTLIPAESSVVLSEDNRSLFEDVDPSFLDTMYAAQGDGRLFYCDEFMLRQLAAEITGARGTWTQAAALPRMLAGRLPRDEYLDIVTKLLELHYRFTAVDIGSIFAQIARDGWSPSAAFELLTKQYFIPNVDVGFAAGVVADVARQAWVSKPHVAAFVRVFGKRCPGLTFRSDADFEIVIS